MLRNFATKGWMGGILALLLLVSFLPGLVNPMRAAASPAYVSIGGINSWYANLSSSGFYVSGNPFNNFNNSGNTADTANGSLHLVSGPSSSDEAGVVLYADGSLTLSQLSSVSITGSGANLGVNLWLDANNNGQFFAVDSSGQLTGLNGDVYVALGSGRSTNFSASGSTPINDFNSSLNGGHTLATLNGATTTAGQTISGNTKVAIWIGNGDNATGETSDVTSIAINANDLAIEGADIIVAAANATSVSGQPDKINVSYTIKNIGNSGTNADCTQEILVNGAITDPGSYDWCPVYPIDSGGTYSATAGPFAVQPGVNNVQITANYYQDGTETNYNNNVFTFTYSPLFPDLVITSVSAIADPADPTWYSVSFTVKNQGNASAAATDSSIVIDGGEISNPTCPALAAGATATVTVPAGELGQITGQSDTIEVIVNPSNVPAESNVNNNSATTIYSIFTIAASAGANGNISPSGTVVVGQGTNKSFTISANAGYHVANVLADGVSKGTVTNYTFNSISAGHTLTASFAANAPAWDVNGDHICDVSDLVAVGSHVGERGAAGWRAEDINKDGFIDVSDLVDVGAFIGQTW